MNRSLIAATVIVQMLGLAHTGSRSERVRDPDTGLIVGTGLEYVKAHCTRCHSTRLISQTRAERDGWLAMIRWMQRSQSLEMLPARTEAAILDYLERNYAPERRQGRRRPLDASLLPP